MLLRTLARAGLAAVIVACAPALAAAQGPPPPPSVDRVNAVGFPRDPDGYVVNEAIILLVGFDGEVEVTGATFTPDTIHPNPYLEITIGGNTRQAGYYAWSAITDLTALFFVYRVQAGDVDADGFHMAANALNLGGTMIVERGSNPPRAANVTFDAQRNSFVQNHVDYKVNGAAAIRPVISSISYSSPPSGNTFYLGETMKITVEFNRAVNVITHVSDPPSSTGTPYLHLNRTLPRSDPDHWGIYQRMLDERTLLFEATVLPGDDPDIPAVVHPEGFILNGAQIVDAADGTTPAIVGYTRAEQQFPGWKFDGSRRRPRPRPPRPRYEETVAFDPASYGTAEGGDAVTVRVTLDQTGDARDVTIPITVTPQGATEADDYTVSGLTDGTLSFAPGEDSQTFTITANEDADLDDETIELGFGTLPEGVSAGETATATVTIQDAGLLALTVAFDPASYSTKEGGDAVTVKVSLDPPADREVTVPITVTAGTAEANDYMVSGLTDGALQFAVGEDSQTFTITANEDEDIDDETLELGFGTLPERVSAGETATATVTIQDAGLPELTVSFTQAESTVAEGGEPASINVNLSPAADRRVEVPLVVRPQGGATSADYDGVPASIVFAIGATAATLQVAALADEENDPGESIVLGFGDLPEAVSAGDLSATTVKFTQQRSAEQFSQSLKIMLAAVAGSVAESAQTAIQSRFERKRQLMRTRRSARSPNVGGSLSALSAGQAGGSGFGSRPSHHLTSFFSAPFFLPSHCQRRNRKETVRKLALAGQCRQASRAVLVRLPVQLRQRFPHHVQLRLAVALEHRSVALAQHLRHEMIRHPPGAEPGRERVAQLV